ncbi:uncharacterized protein [Primulina huaijiensis]|uniref:uncharacterized protein n=1 Tax=Primulina huaijiensis TaxID=1492673 RepID=UPI003CC6FF52
MRKVEYEVLARSFVTISDDPIIDNDQKAKAFWRRVASYHNDNHRAESTAIKCLFKFCGHVVELFVDRSLRRSNDDDVQRFLQMHYESHSFPGMLGSLNCMNWNGTIAQLLGNASLQEAIGHQQLCLKWSRLKTCGYGMHSSDFLCPEDPKRRLFKERKEAARKDVERAFGVPQPQTIFGVQSPIQ